LLLLLPLSATAKENTLIIGGKSCGPITAKCKRADLVRFFGKSNLKEAPIPIGEGETVPGTVVFPKDSKRRLEIIWTRSKQVGEIRLSGSSSLWHTQEGISLGTTLQELHRQNGVAFQFSGFGWDYGGTVLDWKGGKLAQALQYVQLTLDPTSDQPMEDVLGDGGFLSDEVLKKGYPIAVRQMRLEFLR
jgi:hypothetical protein